MSQRIAALEDRLQIRLLVRRPASCIRSKRDRRIRSGRRARGALGAMVIANPRAVARRSKDRPVPGRAPQAVP
ncbi:hypothetical protein [Sphingomonas sp. TREG-RG-20F-R18-01]|uniref:hypothetical protein n=1 Tax=Sphingomonas sp. TREG-RG-20F-R18-01 TaxID=2914982 RepID=UPI001F588BB0